MATFTFITLQLQLQLQLYTVIQMRNIFLLSLLVNDWFWGFRIQKRIRSQGSDTIKVRGYGYTDESNTGSKKFNPQF